MSAIKNKNSVSEKIVLQMIDVSSKMLYNEVKAEQEFVTMINATISHELRNPLNSLVGQINQLQNMIKEYN